MANKKRISIVVVFGENAADSYMEEGIKAMRRTIEDDGDGALLRRYFDTDAERQAYIQGISDMEGWQGYAIIDDEDCTRYRKAIKELLGE